MENKENRRVIVKMRVLQINSVCGVGSTGRIATDLYAVMKKCGIESKIAYGLGHAENIPEKDTFYFGNKIDYYFHNAISRITDKAGFYSQTQTRKLINYIKSYHPDLIHIHNIHGYYLNVEILFDFLKEYNRPVIWTIHDCWPFTGHCAHYSDNQCYKWKTQCDGCCAKKRYPVSYFISNAKENFKRKKKIFTGVDCLHITTPSDWLADQVRESFLGCYPVTTVFNGVDLNIFKPTASNFRGDHKLEGKKIILGVSSAWIPQKGLKDFITLSGELSDEYVIVLIGLSEKQKHNLTNNILALPIIQNAEELAAIYSSADIYVSFSVEETFGLPTVESIACGTPVLTYDETALPEPVNNRCGVVVPARRVDLAYEKLIQFPSFDKKEVRKEALKYDKEKVYLDFIKLYREYLLGKNDEVNV